MFSRVWDKIDFRMDVCQSNNGAHIELLLGVKEVKDVTFRKMYLFIMFNHGQNTYL